MKILWAAFIAVSAVLSPKLVHARRTQILYSLNARKNYYQRNIPQPLFKKLNEMFNIYSPLKKKWALKRMGCKIKRQILRHRLTSPIGPKLFKLAKSKSAHKPISNRIPMALNKKEMFDFSWAVGMDFTFSFGKFASGIIKATRDFWARYHSIHIFYKQSMNGNSKQFSFHPRPSQKLLFLVVNFFRDHYPSGQPVISKTDVKKYHSLSQKMKSALSGHPHFFHWPKNLQEYVLKMTFQFYQIPVVKLEVINLSKKIKLHIAKKTDDIYEGYKKSWPIPNYIYPIDLGQLLHYLKYIEIKGLLKVKAKCSLRNLPL